MPGTSDQLKMSERVIRMLCEGRNRLWNGFTLPRARLAARCWVLGGIG